MGRVEAVLGRAVESNNRRIARHHGTAPNPWPLDGLAWHEQLVAAYPDIRSEWDRFADAGGRLPLIEDLVSEDQGNDGPWRAGLLVSRGRPVPPLAERFPRTVEALSEVGGLRSALWSWMGPGTELPEHRGPNAGVLRYHLGVRCGMDAGLRVDGTEVAYRDGVGVLFDDTAPHSAWNRGTDVRVTLFCEILTPLPMVAGWCNRGVQALISLDPRYRRAPRRAASLDQELNG